MFWRWIPPVPRRRPGRPYTPNWQIGNVLMLLIIMALLVAVLVVWLV